MNYLINKLENKIGFDINGDGRIGGPGIGAKIEQKTHVDLNGDGVIGGHRPTPGGGLVGKLEKITRIDINRDGYIGGAPGGLRPSKPPKKHW